MDDKDWGARRVPAGWAQVRIERPIDLILRDAGMQPLGKYPFPTRHNWTPERSSDLSIRPLSLSRRAWRPRRTLRRRPPRRDHRRRAHQTPPTNHRLRVPTRPPPGLTDNDVPVLAVRSSRNVRRRRNGVLDPAQHPMWCRSSVTLVERGTRSSRRRRNRTLGRRRGCAGCATPSSASLCSSLLPMQLGACHP